MSRETSKNVIKSVTDENINLPLYITNLMIALESDIQQFLLKFEERKSFRYRDFVEVWQENNFSYIFAGHEYFHILKSFLDNVIFYLKKFLVFPKSVYTQTGAFYLLYAVFLKQPVKKLCKLRISLNEFNVLQNLIEQFKESQELEPIFIYSHLISILAFEFVFVKKPMSPEYLHEGHLYNYENDTFSKSSDAQYMEDFKKAVSEENFFKKLKLCCLDYESALKKFNDSTLDVNHPNIIENIEEIINDKGQDEYEDKTSFVKNNKSLSLCEGDGGFKTIVNNSNKKLGKNQNNYNNKEIILLTGIGRKNFNKNNNCEIKDIEEILKINKIPAKIIEQNTD